MFAAVKLTAAFPDADRIAPMAAVLAVLKPISMFPNGLFTVNDEPLASSTWPLVEVVPAILRLPAVTATPGLICRTPPVTVNWYVFASGCVIDPPPMLIGPATVVG